MSLEDKQILHLKIEKLSFNGGRGVARHKGFVIFIPDTLPDEEVEVQIHKVKKNYAEGILLKVITPSPHRVSPPCSHFGKCGGCCWQHIQYDQQVIFKAKIFAEFLGKLPSSPLPLPFVPSPKTLNYRNRIQVHKNGNTIGFHRRGSHHVEAIRQCLIADHHINDYLARHREQFPPGRTEIFLDHTSQAHHRKSVQHNALYFSQVNVEQNENLKRTISLWIHNLDIKFALDLYCGAGNFTSVLSHHPQSPQICGVDASPFLIKMATQANTNSNINFRESDVGKYLKTTPQLPPKSLVLLDPPRPGCDATVTSELLRLKPEYILYISCNPSTLTRDLSSFVAQDYRIVQTQGFDMFPQTDHIESTTLITRL